MSKVTMGKGDGSELGIARLLTKTQGNRLQTGVNEQLFEH